MKWAPVIPLIGGMPLAAESFTGMPPQAVYSYDGFWANDSQYMNYQTNVKNRNLQYVVIDDATKADLDFTVCTPPLNACGLVE